METGAERDSERSGGRVRVLSPSRARALSRLGLRSGFEPPDLAARKVAVRIIRFGRSGWRSGLGCTVGLHVHGIPGPALLYCTP